MALEWYSYRKNLLPLKGQIHLTVNPLYNGICYNRKIRYNVNLVSTKTADRVFFHSNSHFILQENIRFVYLLESPRRGDSNKYTKRMIYKKKKKKKKKKSKISVIRALDGSYQVSL